MSGSVDKRTGKYFGGALARRSNGSITFKKLPQKHTFWKQKSAKRAFPIYCAYL